jgi:Domain of unknown function (DUF4380)
MSELSVLVDSSGPDVVVWLGNGLITIGVVPALGGRIMSVEAGGQELLFRNPRLLDPVLHRTPAEAFLPRVDGSMRSWRNYGGDKTWPAPQGWGGPGEWPGPPDEVLDSGGYEHVVEERDGGIAVELTSAADPRTGLRVGRHVAVEPGRCGYTLTLSFTNASTRPVTWAIWNVTQVLSMAAEAAAPEDGLYVAVDGDGDGVVEMFSGTGLPAWRRAAEGVLHLPIQDVVGKLGFADATGWLAFVAGERVLCQRFKVRPGATYPDGGSRAETWFQYPLNEPLSSLGDLKPEDHLVECEVLGPLTLLAPGQTTELAIDCDAATAAGGPVLDVTTAGFITRRLTASARLEGEYGVFCPGRLALAWWSETGAPLDEQPLGEVTPTEAVIVDAPTDRPALAAEAVLILITDAGQRSILDRWRVEQPPANHSFRRVP